MNLNKVEISAAVANKIELGVIIGLMGVGILFLSMCLSVVPSVYSYPHIPLLLIFGFQFSFMAFFFSPYFWKDRRDGKGYYWDEDGIVISFKGNTVYWNEIEKVEFENLRVNQTVIYTRYNYQELIKHHKRYQFAFVWFDIEDPKPKEFYSNLIRTWNRKKSLYKDDSDNNSY